MKLRFFEKIMLIIASLVLIFLIIFIFDTIEDSVVHQYNLYWKRGDLNQPSSPQESEHESIIVNVHYLQGDVDRIKTYSLISKKKPLSICLALEGEEKPSCWLVDKIIP